MGSKAIRSSAGSRAQIQFHKTKLKFGQMGHGANWGKIHVLIQIFNVQTDRRQIPPTGAKNRQIQLIAVNAVTLIKHKFLQIREIGGGEMHQILVEFIGANS